MDSHKGARAGDARRRPSFPLYHIQQILSSKSSSAISTNFFPKFSHFYKFYYNFLSFFWKILVKNPIFSCFFVIFGKIFHFWWCFAVRIHQYEPICAHSAGKSRPCAGRRNDTPHMRPMLRTKAGVASVLNNTGAPIERINALAWQRKNFML